MLGKSYFKPIKVIRLTSILDFGGIEKRLCNTALYEGDDVLFTYVSLGKGGYASDYISKLGKRVILLESSIRIPNLRLVAKLVRLFSFEKPDVVHCSSAEANFHGILAAWIARIPMIVGEEVGFPKHSKLGRFLFRNVYRLCDRYIAISEAVKDKLVSLRELPSSKISVVYNPVVLPDVQPSRERDGRLRLLLVSRLEKIKNIDGLLRVLARIRERVPEFVVHIVGSGSEETFLKETARSLGMDSIVHFSGFVSDPTTFYRTSDVFLLPSFSEGLSNSLLEAMSHELLCLTTSGGGPRELIVDGSNGFLFDPYVPAQMEEIIINALNLSREEADRMGKRARYFIETEFSIPSYVSRLKAVYRQE